MKHFIKLLLLLSLLSFSVYGIGLIVPEEKYIIFKPDLNLSLGYGVGNSNSRFTEYAVSVNAGKLQKYVVEPEFVIGLLSRSQRNFVVKIQLPSKLDFGVYPVFVKVGEQSDSASTSGITGAVHIFNIISPANQGYVSGVLAVDEINKREDDISFALELSNIGMAPLDFNRSAVLEQKGVIKGIVQIEKLDLKPFDKVRLKSFFDNEYLESGQYTVKIDLGNGQLLSDEIVIGEPVIVVKDVSKIKANAFNDIVIRLFVENWSTSLENVSLDFHVANLVQVSQQVSLYPGENNVNIRAFARSGKSGNYSGNVKIVEKGMHVQSPLSVDVEGSKMMAGAAFNNVDESVEKENYELEITRVNKSARTKSADSSVVEESSDNYILLMFLAFGFAVFVFILGRFFGKQKDMSVKPPLD